MCTASQVGSSFTKLDQVLVYTGSALQQIPSLGPVLGTDIYTVGWAGLRYRCQFLIGVVADLSV